MFVDQKRRQWTAGFAQGTSHLPHGSAVPYQQLPNGVFRHQTGDFLGNLAG